MDNNCFLFSKTLYWQLWWGFALSVCSSTAYPACLSSTVSPPHSRPSRTARPDDALEVAGGLSSLCKNHGSWMNESSDLKVSRLISFFSLNFLVLLKIPSHPPVSLIIGGEWIFIQVDERQTRQMLQFVEYGPVGQLQTIHSLSLLANINQVLWIKWKLVLHFLIFKYALRALQTNIVENRLALLPFAQKSVRFCRWRMSFTDSTRFWFRSRIWIWMLNLIPYFLFLS